MKFGRILGRKLGSAIELGSRMTLRWRDSRVRFRNLKRETYLNTVTPEDAAKIWYPQVVFYNTEEMKATKVTYSFRVHKC